MAAPQAPNTIARMVVDLEQRFAAQFHKANDFPAPPPFTNCTVKTYPSQAASKQQQAAKGSFTTFQFGRNQIY